MTFALTALSAAFVLGSIIVAILAVIGGYAWGKMIARDAEEEARRIAKEVAEAQIQDWIANEGPRFMADSLALIMPLDDENKAKGEADAAKAIGEVA